MTLRHRHKFNAKTTTIDGIRFASQKEARYYHELKLRQRAGDIVFFLRQVPIHLPGNVKYVIDFLEFHDNGTVHFVDVKGYRTAKYLMKKKMVESLYPITLEEV